MEARSPFLRANSTMDGQFSVVDPYEKPTDAKYV
jgi:hypothetical protein